MNIQLPSMIMFSNDWSLPNNKHCIIDYQTSNESFLELSASLRKMGINNCDFHLQLHNRDLVGVDPYDENLTQAQKRAITLECSTNYFYIVREIIRLTVVGTPAPVKFKLNRASLAILWSAFIGLTMMVILQRQTGKTVTLSTLVSILVNFVLVNSDVNLITKDSTLRGDTVDKVKDITFNLPDYLQLADKGKNRGSETFKVGALNNELKTALAQRSKIAANNVGRGSTSSWTLFDEFSFLYNLKTMLTAALSAGTAAREISQANGLPFGTAFFSTAGYLATETGKFAHSVYTGAFRFTEELYDCSSKQEVRDIIHENSTGRGSVLLIEYSHRQLNKTDAWLKQVIIDNMADEMTAAVEFMNIWLDSSSESALNADLVKRVMGSSQRTIYTTMSPIVIRWYVEQSDLQAYRNGRPLILGVDSSDMLGGDSSCIVLTDPTNGAVIGVAEFRKSLINEFATAIATLLLTFPKSVLIIETRSTGMAILDIVYKILVANNINIFYRVFNWLVQEDQTTNNKYTNDNYIANKRHFGYKTGAGDGKNSRKQMYDNALHRVVSTVGHLIRDKDLISDICALEMKNNRITHQASRHDDLVVSYLLTQWLLYNGRNLDKYGLNKLTVLSNISETDNKTIKNHKAIDEIVTLMDKVKLERKTLKPIQLIKLKTKILKLKRKLKDSDIKSINLDSTFDSLFDT